MCLAYLDACGDDLVHSSTFINSGVDYEDAGVAARVFTDPATLESLSRRMERHGYLPGKDIARTFDLLRANDLVFRYVVDSWLLGDKPPAFDLLAWNADYTNLPGQGPRRVPAQGLPRERAGARRVRRARRAADGLGDRHRLLHRRRRSTTTSSRGAVSYRTTQLFKGPMRFVMTSGGHIAGDREPAGAEGAALDQRRAPARRATLAGGRRPSTATPGGTTGAGGWPNAPASSRRRRRWAAPSTRRPASRPAST